MHSFFRSVFLASLVAASPPAFSQSLNSASGSDSGVPAGAVIPFATACPSGYSELTQAAGRAIIGSGSFSESFRGNTFSTSYPRGAVGGVASYRMNTNEMPRHAHGMSFSFYSGNVRGGRKYFWSGQCGTFRDPHCGAPEANTSFAGGGQAFDNRQPYIALTMCRKN